MENNLKLKVKKLDDRAVVPSKRLEDAGYDFYIVYDNDFKLLEIGEIFLAPTKISIEIPKEYVLVIFERGSTGSKGISRRCGIIDSGYRGEIFVALNNTTNKKILFFKDESKIDTYLNENNLKKEEVILYPQSKAIAQGLILPSLHFEVEVVDSLSESLRGDGKIGSSGK